jgi:flagellar motor protein MotB
MSKQLRMIAILAAMTVGVANAQKNTSPFQQPNRWTIGITTGATSPFHDVRRAEYVNVGDLSYNLGAHLTAWQSPAFGIRGQMTYGQVGGQINQAQYISRLGLAGVTEASTTYFAGDLLGVINFSGFGLKGQQASIKERRWNFYGILGLGFISYSARLRDLNTNQFLPATDFGRSSGIAMNIPVGLGLSYKVAPKFHIDFDLLMRNLNTNNFDGLAVQKGQGPGLNEPHFGRNLDKFATANISFVFHLGSNRQGNSNYWNRSYFQQYYAQSTEENNRLENKVSELTRKNQDQDVTIADLAEKIASLERQLRSSEAEMRKDSDGDGVPDVFDKEDTRWDLSGLIPSPCGWSEEEIKQLRDKAARNDRIFVDGSGVALDIDNDGIPDHLDKCPTVPGIPSCHGCKPEPKAETVKIMTDLQSVEFESGLSDFVDCGRKRSRAEQEACRQKQEQDMENLRNLVNYLNEVSNTMFKLRITGHTDDVGSAESNMELSRQRALSVKARLVSMGVSADRIITEGRGEEDPKFGPSGTDGNFTAADRNRNRRIELAIE